MRGVLAGLILMVLGMFMAVLIVEGAGRLNPNILPQRIQDATGLVGTRGIGQFARDQATIITGDPYTGIHLKPDVHLFLRGHPDYSYHIDTTALGTTGTGIRGTPVTGRPFAVAVGDSHTFGAGSEIGDVWVTRLSGLLDEQVTNLGIPSACSTQYTRMYERYGVPLHPRVVIWEAYTGDLVENVWFDTWLRSGGGQFYDWHEWARKVATSGRLGWVASVKNWLNDHSITFDLMKLVVAGVGYHYHSPTMDIIFGAPFHLSMTDPVIARGWVLMQKAILDADALASHEGATLVVVYWPEREEVYAPLLRGKFLMKEDGLGVMQQNLRALTTAHGIHFLDMTPGLAGRGAAGEQLFFRQDGHFNRRGNEAIAKLITRYLVEQHLAGATAAVSR